MGRLTKVFPRSKKRVPRVPMSTLNDTSVAWHSQGSLYSQRTENKKKRWGGGERQKKSKTLFCFSLILSSVMLLWCKPALFFFPLFVTPHKWKCEEKQRNMRQPGGEREGRAWMVEHWDCFHTNSWERKMEHLVNVLPTVVPFPNA